MNPETQYDYRLVKTFTGIHSKTISQLAASPSGRYIASVSDDKTVAVFDLCPSSFSLSLQSSPSFPKLVRQYEPADDKASAIVWGNKDTLLFVGFDDGRVCTYGRPTRTTVSHASLRSEGFA